ncbi:zeta-sarcoglycan isoform X2 [Haemorhous mexicanus]|uniref:zeta-sarcoglycan isoform X2 n=1 Tax=Haemorhous mexicanus TaxID=30427 RepID=UPI0028BE0FA9|nr:zeta-sarcoglycan isoform X2 [Haemorhous mexicanus]
MDRSANLDTEELKVQFFKPRDWKFSLLCGWKEALLCPMTREQYILATQQNSLPRTEHPQFYPVGIYGWRKRCLYFFVLLLLVTMIVNLAMTIWILKVMNFTVDSPLVLQSDRNVTVNARNHMGQLTGQLTVGADAVEAQCKRFEVRASDSGRVLFSADEDEIVIGADRLKVTGTEGAVFGHSVETPHIRAEPSQDLKLESPTRSLVMEAPRGVQVNAAAGDLKATCRKELHLQSTEGEIFLNADTIRLGNLPVGSFSSSSSSFSSSSSPSSSAPRQTIYELCACPNVQFGFPCDKPDAPNGLQSNFFHCKQEYSAAFSCGLCCHSAQRWEREIQKTMYSSSGNLEHKITLFSKRDNNTEPRKVKQYKNASYCGRWLDCVR